MYSPARISSDVFAAWRSLAADNRSGAGEIYVRAVRTLRDHFASLAEGPEALRDWPHWLHGLLQAQSMMAPLYNLCNRLALALESGEPAQPRSEILKILDEELAHAPSRESLMAQHASQAISSWRRVMTHSYSSAVAAALQQARTTNASLEVFISEARPMNEGRRMAERLAQAGTMVHFFVDDARGRFIAAVDGVLLGADRISENVFVNKIGTASLVNLAGLHGKPVFIVSQANKFWPSRLHLQEEAGHLPDEIWPHAPANVLLHNFYFEEIALAPGIGILTENGLLTPAAIEAYFKNFVLAKFWTHRA